MDQIKELILILESTLPKDLLNIIKSKYIELIMSFKISSNKRTINQQRICDNIIFPSIDTVTTLSLSSSAINFTGKVIILMRLHSGKGEIPTVMQLCTMCKQKDDDIKKILEKQEHPVCDTVIYDEYNYNNIVDIISMDQYNFIHDNIGNNFVIFNTFGKDIIKYIEHIRFSFTDE